MKRIFAILISSVIAFTMVLPTVAFASDDIDVSLEASAKQSPEVSDADVVIGAETTTITYEVAGTGDMIGEEISAMAIITDTETGKVETAVSPVTVDSDTTTVEVTIRNAKDGEELTHYVVNDIGAVIKNRAPAEIKNFVGKSTGVGAKITWDAVADDFNHVVYDVYKEGELWLEGIEETEAIFEMDEVEFLDFYVVARDHEGLQPAPTETVQAGKYIPKFVDFDNYDSSSSPITVMANAVSHDAGVHEVEITDVNGETHKAYATYSSAERRELTGGKKTYPSRIQFQAKGVIDPEEKPAPHHVVVTVKYFDTDTGDITVKYAKDGVQATLSGHGWSLTNTNTWKEVTFEIKDAHFTRNGSNGVDGADIWFNGGKNGIISINKVTIIPYEYY